MIFIAETPKVRNVRIDGEDWDELGEMKVNNTPQGGHMSDQTAPLTRRVVDTYERLGQLAQLRHTHEVSRRQFCYQLVLIGAVVGEFVLVDFGTNAWDVTNRDAAIDDIDGIGQ